MAYFKTCPLCGANLDPGEECDCDSVDSVEVKIKKAPAEPVISASADVTSDITISISLYYKNKKKSRGNCHER